MTTEKEPTTRSPWSQLKRHLASFGIRKECESLIERLSMMVASGMSLYENLDDFAREKKSSRMRKLVLAIRDDVGAGTSLWRALQSTGAFPPYSITLVRIGEESGKLPQNLQAVVRAQQKANELRSQVRSAMLYPMFVFALTLVVGVALAWFILPKLAGVFSQLHLKLPLITRVLIGTGFFLQKYGIIAIPLTLVVLAVLGYFGFVFPRTKTLGQHLLFATPGVRSVIAEIELARFGYLLSTLLDAGLPVNTVLDLLVATPAFPAYHRLYLHMQRSIDEGHSFRETFASYKHSDRLIPSAIQQMISAGERSGRLTEMLKEVNRIYEEKASTITKDLAVMLEPFLLVIVWLGVLAVAFAVILPIYGLIGGLSTQ